MRRVIQGVVASAAVVSAAVAGEAVQWRVEDGGNGHWYQFVPQNFRWVEADALARGQAGYLATITSANEHAFVSGVNADRAAWLGGYQAPGGCEPGCDWSWVTGEPWGFAPWDTGQPDNAADGEHWLQFHGNSRWNDNRAVVTYPFIVEWSADCNNDGIVDYGQCRDGSLPDYNSNNIPDCCENGQACFAGNYPVQWKVSEGGNGHWYEVRDSGSALNWNQARDSAAGLGGRLASFETLAEFSRVATTIATRPQFWTQRGNFWRGPWIGGFQDPSDPTFSEPAGGWRWDSGVPIDLNLLAVIGKGNPNNFPCCEDRMQFGEGQFTPTVNDVRADDPAISFVVEYSADCNSDGIVDYGQILQGQLADANDNGVPDSCESPTCADADLYPNGAVNGADLGIMLSEWGAVTPATSSDLNRDGTVDGSDLGILLAFWGPCAP
jgi:hypothetical protein